MSLEPTLLPPSRTFFTLTNGSVLPPTVCVSCVIWAYITCCYSNSDYTGYSVTSEFNCSKLVTNENGFAFDFQTIAPTRGNSTSQERYLPTLDSEEQNEVGVV